MKPEGKENWEELTAGEVFAGAVISSSLLVISNSSENTPVARSRSPSAKLSIFSLALERVVFVVESSIQLNASCWIYRFLISSYLHFS